MSQQQKKETQFVTGVFLFFLEVSEAMRETKIRLNVDDVSSFVNAAAECDFDVDVNYNRILIDAKSILGVMSLDLSNILTVRWYGENPRFERFLQKYVVA